MARLKRVHLGEVRAVTGCVWENVLSVHNYTDVTIRVRDTTFWTVLSWLRSW